MALYKAKKAGITLAAQKKEEEKYNVEENLGTPERIMQWMNETLGADVVPCPGSQWRKFQFWLRDGVVLCKFINKLRESARMSPIKYQGNAHVEVVACDNIDAFNKAAVEYGLPETVAFRSSDLYQANKATLYHVINCLNKLGCEANKRGFTPSFQYIEAPLANNDVHT